ncbi:Ig-like domain-containing protein [uncultured Robinsoniella sp.]|uniref:Ig-like domain-containing protein n=1 Tax=uncultured Robinsoniella sp. TaxID=904190 RepID=UPI00374F4DDA
MKRTTKAKSLSVLMAAMVAMSSFSVEAFAAGQDSADSIVAQYQQAAANSVQADLYQVSAAFWKADKDEVSMSNGIIKGARYILADGGMQLYLDVQKLTISMGGNEISAYMQGLQYKTAREGSSSEESYTDAEVTAYDEDGNIAQVKLVLPENAELTDIMLDSGMMGTHAARLYLDLENAEVQNVDKGGLNDQILTASGYTASDYTDESFQNLQTVLQAARAIAESPIALQSEVSDQSDALAAAVKALIKKVAVADGNYTIPVSMWHALTEQPSMGNDAIVSSAGLTVKDGKGTLNLTLIPLDLQGLKGYLGWMKKVTPDGSVDAEVLSSYDVYDSFNDKENGTDPQMKGKAYPSSLSLPVEINQNETEIQMYIPVMEGIQSGAGTQNARLRLDWTKLTPVKEEEPAVDFSALNAKLNSARAIKNNGIYTKSSFDALQSAIAKAQAVAGNQNSKQADVDQALRELQNAVNGLVKESPVPAAALALDKSNITLYTKGSTTATLKAAVTGSSQAVTWKSSNTAVVEVLNGKLTAKKAGTAVITATANGISKTCTVTVKAPALKLSKSKATLYINGNKTITLKAGVTGASSKVTWKSANKKIAVVKNGKVTAKKTGTVKIKATANGITKTCMITVKKQKLNLAASALELKKGKQVKIAAKAVPSGKITYTTNKKKVATVTGKGVVKAKKKGTAKITVQCNGLKKTVTVKVK